MGIAATEKNLTRSKIPIPIMLLHIARIGLKIELGRVYQVHDSPFFHLEFSFKSKWSSLDVTRGLFHLIHLYTCLLSSHCHLRRIPQRLPFHDANANSKLLEICHFLLQHPSIGRFKIWCINAADQRHRFEVRVLVSCNFQHV